MHLAHPARKRCQREPIPDMQSAVRAYHLGSMSARGMNTREIQEHLHEIYGLDISPDPVSPR